MLLAGDIGGTKTHLAIFENSGDYKILREEKFKSKDHKALSEILLKFLSTHKEKIEKVSLGIAGPVQDGRCHATNLPWIVDTRELAEILKISKIWLINDLEANAYGIPILKKEEFFVLNQGLVGEKGNAAIISAGTGLGEAGLFWDGEKHRPFACEGGHTDFAPREELEIELWRYLSKRFDHVSYERLISGPGLYNIYRFLIDRGLENEPDWLKKELEEKEPPRVITEQAFKKTNKACVRALEWFVSIYGSEAGNVALEFLAVSGLYIGGGIAPKILDAMGSGIFMKAFVAKGRFATLLSSIPVKIILNENTALLGAASYARQHK